jgi:hypothetical protein
MVVQRRGQTLRGDVVAPTSIRVYGDRSALRGWSFRLPIDRAASPPFTKRRNRIAPIQRITHDDRCHHATTRRAAARAGEVGRRHADSADPADTRAPEPAEHWARLSLRKVNVRLPSLMRVPELERPELRAVARYQPHVGAITLQLHPASPPSTQLPGNVAVPHDAHDLATDLILDHWSPEPN